MAASEHRASTSQEDGLEHGRRRYRGKPLASKTRFLLTRLIFVATYLVVAAGALLSMFVFEQWLLLGVGATILAVVGGFAVEVILEGVFEIPKAFDYGEYRREWELANADIGAAQAPPAL